MRSRTHSGETLSTIGGDMPRKSLLLIALTLPACSPKLSEQEAIAPPQQVAAAEQPPEQIHNAKNLPAGHSTRVDFGGQHDGGASDRSIENLKGVTDLEELNIWWPGGEGVTIAGLRQIGKFSQLQKLVLYGAPRHGRRPRDPQRFDEAPRIVRFRGGGILRCRSSDRRRVETLERAGEPGVLEL